MCGWCGGNGWCNKDKCPTKDATCHKCNSKGHCARCCKSKQTTTARPVVVKHISESYLPYEVNYNASEYQFMHNIMEVEQYHMVPEPLGLLHEHIRMLMVKADKVDDAEYRTILISEGTNTEIHQLDAEIDTDAGMNCLPEYLCLRMLQKEMDPSGVILKGYGAKPKEVRGKVDIHLHTH